MGQILMSLGENQFRDLMDSDEYSYMSLQHMYNYYLELEEDFFFDREVIRQDWNEYDNLTSLVHNYGMPMNEIEAAFDVVTIGNNGHYLVKEY